MATQNLEDEYIDRTSDEYIMNDLWYSIKEDSDDREASRPPLIRYIHMAVAKAKELDSHGKLTVMNTGIPIAFDEKTGINIAYSMLALFAACDWITERREPSLYRMFRLVALLSTNNVSGERWHELFELNDTLT